MSGLQDKLKAIWNKFCPYINKVGQYFQNNIGTQQGRFKLYRWMLGLGIVLCFLHSPILCFLTLFTSLGDDNHIFASTLAIFLLTLPVVSFNWYLKNHDQLQQFRDTNQQQTETLFSNAVQLLFKQGDIHANSVGLKELIRLRQATEDQELIKRIDLITSSGLELKGAKLQGANLQEANLQEANLQQADLQGAFLQGANLQQADLQVAFLQEADLQEAKLQGAKLQGTKLQGAKLQGAKLQQANLQGADLQQANLQGAKLQQADLQGTKLQQADLQGTIYNDQTKFPQGFDPQAAGMKHEQDLPKETE